MKKAIAFLRGRVDLFAVWLLAIIVLSLAGSADAATVTLTWKDNSTDETGFKIERRLRADPVASYAEITSVGANVQTIDDATITLNTQYCFRVRGFSPVALSEFSNEACMMVTPSGLVVTFKSP
jgi:hypothetical protein